MVVRFRPAIRGLSSGMAQHGQCIAKVLRCLSPAKSHRPGETVDVSAAPFEAALGPELQGRVRVVDLSSCREILAQGVDLDGDSHAEPVVFRADFGPREARASACGARRL